MTKIITTSICNPPLLEQKFSKNLLKKSHYARRINSSKKRKLMYIQIKNSWREPGKSLLPFTITTYLGEIYMDFSKKDDIVKYGLMQVK